MLGLSYESMFAGAVTVGERSIDGNQLKWSTFRDFPAQKMYITIQEWVFPFMKELHGNKRSAYSKYMSDAMDEMYVQMASGGNKLLRSRGFMNLSVISDTENLPVLLLCEMPSDEYLLLSSIK